MLGNDAMELKPSVLGLPFFLYQIPISLQVSLRVPFYFLTLEVFYDPYQGLTNIVSVTATQLCHCSAKATIENT